ncbi:MAG TPA: hypothetical protein ENK18_24335 [Deltaproteobacteria bacterium]|nr:hypothetical protein [Deltaproteobacteria bacterium]
MASLLRRSETRSLTRLCYLDPMIVFAYGSLMYEPELPSAILERRPARLVGHSRRFNKRSRSRGCPLHNAPPGPGVPGFVDGDLRLSLVLGTVPGGHMDGLMLRYDPAHAPKALAQIERREGAAYLRTEVEIHVSDGTSSGALAWLTNPRSPLLVELEPMDQAAILRAATPIQDVDGRARGAHYLLGVQRALAKLQTPDPGIDALVEELRTVQRR